MNAVMRDAIVTSRNALSALAVWFVSQRTVRSTQRSLSSDAGIAQLVEHNLAKVGVAGSSPVSRSSRWGMAEGEMSDGRDSV